MKLPERLQDLLFPPKCVLCGRLLEKEETNLCHDCRSDAPLFSRSKTKLPYIAGWTAVWYYEDMVRSSLLRYKFSNARSYADVYGQLLALVLQRERVSFDLLTWVPVSRRRKRKRGYDQVQLLAQAVGRELGVTPVAALKKLRDNPPQSGISGAAERRANVLGVYAPTDPALVQGKRVLLLDDILTTGATAGECARVLLSAGAREVYCAAVAASRYQHQ